jgi:hypothetical protein
VLAAAVILWMLSHATRREFVVEGMVLAIAASFYAARRKSAPGRAPRTPTIESSRT